MSAMQRAWTWAASSTLFHVAFGFVLMGAWAVFANRNHPLPAALLAGLVQGTLSGLLTLGLKKALEAMNARFAGAPAWIVPPLITASVLATILFVAHTLAGTPEVLATIAFPWSVSTTYAFVYTVNLCRARQNRAKGSA